LTEYWRTPSGAIGALPMSFGGDGADAELLVRAVAAVTLVSTVYIGWAPIWYGHQTCGARSSAPGT